MSNPSLFRPSAMLRRTRCPGSMALESTLPPAPEEDANEDQKEGRMLHLLMADPSLPRNGLKDAIKTCLSPEQFETVERAEAMEAEFIKMITG